MPTQNRLAQETSPYLQQHADNPVDWHPWGAEALNKAKAEDKPILLSIGYSACHWCHVMAHESFEDADTAALMNKLFINIKVDREERPDLDQIYQSAHAMLTKRNGGWPLTMFLMPDQTPFYGGTYFPKTARYGLPGFADLITQVADAYHNKRAELETQNAHLRDALTQEAGVLAEATTLSAAPLKSAISDMQQYFDHEEGGIGSSPKFPHAIEFSFCLQHAFSNNSGSGDRNAHNMVRQALSAMADGGIYDHLGGGFCRYSVDRSWTIPHFEKMLYDNALLLALYSDAWRAETPAARPAQYARVVEETAAWVMREMQSQDGGYYSALDADSEHEEGKFYVWNRNEIKALLTPDEYTIVSTHYGLNETPNFEGHWHLRVMMPLATVAQHHGTTPDRAQALLDSARAKLFAAREQRVHPGRDEKILTSWNALMIKGMARAARVFDRADWLASARAATEYLCATLWQNGRLLATAKDGRAHLNAYLDDYAYLLDALLELMQTDFRLEDLAWARALADALLEQFEDPQNAGFFFTSHDHETLLQRVKNGHDQATPSGNGVAAHALQRLGHILGETHYLDAAERTLRAFQPHMEHAAMSHTSLCLALSEYLKPPTLVILRSATETSAPETPAWQREIEHQYRPHVIALTILSNLNALPATLDKPALRTMTAWVCHGSACLPPITALDALMTVLQTGSN